MPVALRADRPGGAGGAARRGSRRRARRRKAGVPFCLSTVSACTLGEVARGTPRALLVPALHDPRPRLHDRPAHAGQSGWLLCVAVHGRHAGARIALSRPALGAGRRTGIRGQCTAHLAGDVPARDGRGTSGAWPPAQPGQCRAGARQEFGARGFLRLDAHQLRFLGHLEGSRLHPRALERAADHQGCARCRGRAHRGRERRRRRRRLEPRRTPARRRALDRARASRRSRRRWATG